MDNEDIYEAEFIDPNRNYEILLEEMKKRLKELQLDLLNINDPEVLGYAQKTYTNLKIEYFKLMRDDLNLQKLFETGDEEEAGRVCPETLRTRRHLRQ